MRTLAALVVLLCAPIIALAHPGSGIVVADDETIYFTDIGRETIWKLDPGESEPAALIENRWTHALYLAPDNTLYYEREHPNGGAAPASFYRYAPDGTHEQLIPPQADRRNFSGANFAIDTSGNVYYAHSVRDENNKWRARIMQRSPDGKITEFSGMGTGPLFTDGDPNTATVRIVTAMTTAPDGYIYFTDRDHIRRIDVDTDTPGRITTIASRLILDDPPNSPHRSGPSTTINRLYAIDVDDQSNVYVAYQAGRRIYKVTPDGEHKTIHSSRGRWSPIGVAARNNNIYILEVADRSITKLRVIRITPDGSTTTLVTMD